MSGWLNVEFPMVGPLASIKGICKIFVQKVHPDLFVYVSPINIDPADPALPICSPDDYSRTLADDLGPFYTQGFPEDTKALSTGALTDGEYLLLANEVFLESDRMLTHELNRFQGQQNGFMFFYFSSLDQNSHMFWRGRDEESPLFSKDFAREYGDTIARYYTRIDRSLGRVLDTLDMDDPNTTIMVISDHGFASFNRQVNLNTWLYNQGLLKLRRRSMLDAGGFFNGVIWQKTAAYNLGINSIYLNLKGREEKGTVEPSDAAALSQKIAGKILEMKDPANGRKMAASVRVITAEEKSLQPQAPDIIVGWNNGYRTSWDSIMGVFGPETVSDNLDPWSGDHCIAPALVPAILISNRPVSGSQPRLTDIGPTILSLFGQQPFPTMTGKSLIKSRSQG